LNLTNLSLSDGWNSLEFANERCCSSRKGKCSRRPPAVRQLSQYFPEHHLEDELYNYL